MKFFHYLFFIFLFNSLFASEVISLQTRDNVKQNFLLEMPKNEAKAIVLLFPGGNGKILLHKDKENWNTKNFLIRSRDYFLQEDFIVVSIDVPSDRRSKDGMYYNFRSSNEHLTDIKRVINYLKNNYQKPIFLIGTSRGTESVAFLASKLNDKINGIILSSSITKKNSKGKSLEELELSEITTPTLIVFNEKDKCRVTPPEGSKQLFDLLSNEIKKEYKIFNGGKNKDTNPCKAMTYHGFLGIEKDVVDYMSQWIKKLI